MDNRKCEVADKKHALLIKQDCSRLWSSPSVDGFLSSPFSIRELIVTINQVKSGRAQGFNNILPEFLKHCGPKCQVWQKKFYSICLSKKNIPKIWRKVTAGELPIPNTPTDDPKTVLYRTFCYCIVLQLK